MATFIPGPTPLVSSSTAGLVPEFTSATGKVFTDGGWATPSAGAPGGSSGQLQWNDSGAFAGLSSSSIDGSGNLTFSARWIQSVNGAASAPPLSLTGTWFTGGTATTTKPHFLIEPAGTTSTAWSTSGTGLGVNAPSGFTGNLLDLQVNGGRHFRIYSTGSGGYAEITVQAGFTNEGLTIGASNSTPKTKLSFSDGLFFSGAGDYDVCLRADGVANTLALRRATNAQTFRCYGTYTDASNYVRAALSSTSTAVTLAAETAGTGADDIPLNLTAAGTGTVKVNSVAEVAVSSTVAGLPATPAVGMITRVTDATAPAVGFTVAGGGAAAALVWWNGSNWTVIGV